MYRLLIVDDEPDAADALYNLLLYNFADSDAAPAVDVLRVYSAAQALDLLSRERIDIILSDIRMPGMDGLELLSHVRRRWPHCQTIFITGHPEFDYIHRATRMDAVSYILKTEGYERILESVRKAAGRIALLNSPGGALPLRPVLEREFARLLAQGSLNAEGLQALAKTCQVPLDARRGVYILTGRVFAPEDSGPLRAAQVRAAAAQLLYTHLSPGFELAADWSDEGLYTVFLQPRPGGEAGAEAAGGGVQMVQSVLLEHHGAFSAFALCAEEVEPVQAGAFCAYLRCGLPERPAGVTLRCASRAQWAAGDGPERPPPARRAVQTVRDYIEQNLHRALSLTELSNLVYLNPSYLSRVFRQETGISLVAYLTRRRVERAKELLAGTNKKVSAIAEELGFESPSYFIQVFRRTTGLSPSEYRAGEET